MANQSKNANNRPGAKASSESSRSRHAAAPGTRTVQDVMIADVVTIAGSASLMADAQVGRLPVADSADRLVGVVTLSSMAFRAPNKHEALETAQEVSRRSARATA